MYKFWQRDVALQRLYIGFEITFQIRNKLTGLTGLEPATSAVTGRCSNQLNYSPLFRALL